MLQLDLDPSADLALVLLVVGAIWWLVKRVAPLRSRLPFDAALLPTLPSSPAPDNAVSPQQAEILSSLLAQLQQAPPPSQAATALVAEAPVVSLRDEVYRLAESGMSVTQIAAALHSSRSEVDLLLALRQ